ncbi:Alpha/Beta hydrolase protein [Pseudomassariella vexata]|uniref:Carboxylic ester hydrolase n=1 Tax=Pseudomassariella vexata TaxID=1141098 RepID=A0A1Y2DAR5_9PEZI|nr:Alpha/Beta hydrolase protein [Pseudomassariella vexata]ORY56349.1 Alpha/Beta hydrolase protein [Pseudomassariella vexata]
MGQTESTVSPYILPTSRGSLRGVEYKDNKTGHAVYRRFAGIPFAQPPVGQLRWRRPQPLPSDYSFTSSDGSPGNFSEFNAICPQPIYNHSTARLENPGAATPIENAQSEDCLYLNVWIPAGTPPTGGWPVQFHIHGGWLQVGNANQSHDHDPFDLYQHVKGRIIVAPTYRLNLFGFLAGKELASLAEDPSVSNYGLWDQRAALEWTAQNIALFGGNPDNITVGGLSAGANSAFYQLHYDTHLPPEKRLIKRLYLWSNAVAIQPDTTDGPALTAQFNEVCSIFNVPETTTTTSDKLEVLRAISCQDLIAGISKLKMHTFRTNTDGVFVPADFLSSLTSGAFATKLAENGTSILLGEVADEALPRHVVEAMLSKYDIPDDRDGDADKWATVFSQMVADGQVHASIRGLTRFLLNPPSGEGVKPLPRGELFRYRIAWRAKGLDAWIDPKMGVCHAADTPIWWGSGWRAGYTEGDGKIVMTILEPFDRFLAGETVGWAEGHESAGPEVVKFVDADGVVHDNHVDELWERGLEVFDAMVAGGKETV